MLIKPKIGEIPKNVNKHLRYFPDLAIFVIFCFVIVTTTMLTSWWLFCTCPIQIVLHVNA